MSVSGISPGIAMGKVIIYRRPKVTVEKKQIIDVELEINRFYEAVEKSINEIENAYHMVLKNMGQEEADIFSAHKVMLQDEEFINQVISKIREEKVSAEYAVKEVISQYIVLFEEIEDEYLKTRVQDLKDVGNRITNVLLGIKDVDLRTLKGEYILVAEDLLPSDMAFMNREAIVGIVMEQGGKTSHVSIMAKSLEIPAIAGVDGITNLLKDGDTMIIDGDTGLIQINPTKEEVEKYIIKRKKSEEFKQIIHKMKEMETISKDGVKVRLVANIGTPDDVDNVIKNGGEGIGLFRTEFLYMNNQKMPTEEEQFKAYKSVVERLNGKPVIIRTLDVGGDKDIPYLDLKKEENPYLGLRAIRLCLSRTDIFKTQLRALLRASYYGNIKVMFPMISTIDELRDAKRILEQVKDDLEKENIPFNRNIQVGIMVEIPSVAILSRLFAKEVDFFSIGTNDLIQYTLAVDRGNHDISYLYSHYNPAVLRLIKMTIDNGHKEGIQVNMCGEAAGDEKLIPVLLAMGLDEFSMNPSSILKARWIINNTSKKDIEPMLDTILNLSTAKEVEEFIDKNIYIKLQEVTF